MAGGLVAAVLPLPLPNSLSSSETVGSVVFDEELTPKASSRISVVGSVVLEEELLESERVKRLSTHCTVCAAAASALATDGGGAAFRSF